VVAGRLWLLLLLATGRSRVTLLTAGRRKPDRSLCFDTLLRAGHSHDLLRAAKPELDLLARIATFQPKLFSAGRPVAIVFLQLSQDGIFVMRRQTLIRIRPCAF
jgi:hypothetical protein